MRAVVQRVLCASLSVEGKLVSEIGKGLVVFLGVTHDDTESDAEAIAKKSRICGFLKMRQER